MYQEEYESKIGSAFLNIDKVVAGRKVDCKLVYKAGFFGIDDNGGMKVLFRIVSDCEELQFNNPEGDNYVKISSNNPDVKIHVNASSTGYHGKIDERPWCKGFSLYFTNSFLKEGDEVYFNFKNWNMQTFCEKTFEFRLLIDPFATARYLKLPKCPEIEIVSDLPERLVVVSPSLVKKGEDFKTLVKIEDKWGNPCGGYDGEFQVGVDRGGNVKCRTVDFEKGKAEIIEKDDKEGLIRVVAKYEKMKAYSNPIKVVEVIDDNYYWAELHGQSEETVGTNDVVDYFEFARDYGFVDIACHQGNDFQITNKFWEKINNTTKSMNKDGEFVAFPGYEWSGNTHNGGDHNVIYAKEGMPILRSSHALLDDYSDINTDANTVGKLFDMISKQNALVISHVGGRYANVEMCNSDVWRAVEIHSAWGTFDWILQDAISQGKRVGVVANSDGHKGRPGASYPGVSEFGSYGGLTCVLARELSRECVFQSIYDRHTYATTGARIYLDVKVEIDGKKEGVMGDCVKKGDINMLNISCCGDSALDRVEIWRDGKIVDVRYPECLEGDKYIKVAWSGSKVRGRGRNFSWNGVFQIEGGEILNVEKINFFNRKNYADFDAQGGKWSGNTTGGVQGVILKINDLSGKISMSINDKDIVVPVSSIGRQALVYDMGGLDAKVEVYEVQSANGIREIDFEYSVDKLSCDKSSVYVKVVQRDGHMAWSSPIFFE